jgi:hypothetical protein
VTGAVPANALRPLAVAYHRYQDAHDPAVRGLDRFRRGQLRCRKRVVDRHHPRPQLRCRPAPTTKACRTATLVSGRPNSGVGANASTASASGSANSPSPGKRLAASLIRELAAEALACRQRVLELDRDLAKLLERHPDAALIALARRRIDVLWAMLHTRQPFQPNHPRRLDQRIRRRQPREWTSGPRRLRR